MKKIIGIVTSILFSLTAYCQSASWLIQPGVYSDIQYFGPDMYKVTKTGTGKVGIIGADGKVILEPKYDDINQFYEGRTVFMNKGGQEWIVRGVLNEDGSIAYSEGTYYLLPNYSFYSEGFLPVRDSSGKYGYLNEEAKPAFSFISEEIHPFSEGLAAVGSGDTFHWITTDGTQVLPRLSNGGTPYNGTNFNNGTAYLWDEDDVQFRLNSNGESSKSKEKDVDIVDYLYCTGTGKGLNIPYHSYTRYEDKTWTPKEKNGKWSYMSARGKLLLPFELDAAAPFSNGVAIAKKDGKIGMLQIIDDKSTFSTKTEHKNLIFSNGTACECEFQLNVPEKWKNQKVTVVMKDPETGEAIEIHKSNDNEYSFSYRPDGKHLREDKRFNVEVSNNGIQLWQGEQKFSFVQKVKVTPRISVNNSTANIYDQCAVTAYIKNPSPIAVNTTVTLYGGGNNSQFNKKTVNLTIPAYSSRSINSAFIVKKVEFNGWCVASTSDGASARKANLQLQPNY